MMGRPPIFESAEDLSKKIDEYFHSKEETTITITGLAFYLGFESRQSFYDYEKKEDFSYIIKRARLRVEIDYEKRLDSKNPTGAIFALKNMGWKDKHEVEQKTTIEDERIDLNQLSAEELKLISELQRRCRTSKT